MIRMFKTTQFGLSEIREFEKDIWVDISNPPNEEIEMIARELNIPIDFLKDPLDVNETSRIGVEENVVLIILRIPLFKGDNDDIPFITLPLGIILTNDLVITICSVSVDIISDFINSKAKKFSIKDRGSFILKIFLKTALLYLKHLKEINKRTASVEKELQKAMKNEELIKLLNIEKSLVFFTTSLKANELMIERLKKMDVIKKKRDNED